MSAYTLKHLLNHADGGDVTGGHYVSISNDQLRKAWQSVTDAIIGAATEIGATEVAAAEVEAAEVAAAEVAAAGIAVAEVVAVPVAAAEVDDEDARLDRDVPSDDIGCAKAGDRTSALYFWRRAAEGEFDNETRELVQFCAKRIVEANAATPKRRAGAMLRAVGLQGVEDHHWEARRFAQALQGFGATREEIVVRLAKDRLIDDNERDARSLVDRFLSKS